VKCVVALAVAALGLLVGGCATQPKIERQPPEPATTAKAVPLELLEEAPPIGSASANEFGLLAAGSDQFNELADDGSIKSRTALTRESTEQFKAAVAAHEGSQRTQFLREDEQGNIVMTAIIDRDDQAISMFDPPLVVAFRELPAGIEQKSQSAMRVVDMNNPSKQRETGTATRTMKYAANQRLRTPMGEFTAKRIDVHFTADLKLADADEMSTIFVVPGAGIVAERSTEQVKVLGAFGHTKRRTIVRDATSAGAGPSANH